jgi:hypothetical protein
MAAKLEKTRYPGIYRRGTRYVVIWKHRGKQHKESFRTLSEAREAKGKRDAGEKRPKSRIRFGEYFAEWIENYAGRTSRGFLETTRPEYRRPIEAHAIERWKTWRMTEVEPADLRDLFGQMRRNGRTTSEIKKTRAALSVMFATALEDGIVQSNPVLGVRIPPPSEDEAPREDKAKALTRADLAILLAAIPSESRLLCTFLAHTGLRISEAVGLRWEHLDLGEHPTVRVREQLYKGKRKRLKSKDGRRDIPSPSAWRSSFSRCGATDTEAPSLPSSRRRWALPFGPKTSIGVPWLPPPSGLDSRSRWKSRARRRSARPSPSTRSATPAPACSLRRAGT